MAEGPGQKQGRLACQSVTASPTSRPGPCGSGSYSFPGSKPQRRRCVPKPKLGSTGLAAGSQGEVPLRGLGPVRHDEVLGLEAACRLGAGIFYPEGDRETLAAIADLPLGHDDAPPRRWGIALPATL